MREQGIVECPTVVVVSTNGHIHQPDLGQGSNGRYSLDKHGCVQIDRLLVYLELSTLDVDAGGLDRLLRDTRLWVMELDQLFWMKLVTFHESHYVGGDPGKTARDREEGQLTCGCVIVTSRGERHRCC